MSGLNRPTAAEYEALRARALDVWTFLRTCDVEGYDRTRECPEFRVLFEPLPAGGAGRAFLDYGRLIALHRALVALGRESRMRRAALGEDCGFENASAWDDDCAGWEEPQRRVASNEAWMNQAGAWLTLAESWIEEGCPERCADKVPSTCPEGLPSMVVLAAFHRLDTFMSTPTCGSPTGFYAEYRLAPGADPAILTLTGACVWEGTAVIQNRVMPADPGGFDWPSDPAAGGEINVMLVLGDGQWEVGVEGVGTAQKTTGETPFGNYANVNCNEEEITSLLEETSASIA